MLQGGGAEDRYTAGGDDGEGGRHLHYPYTIYHTHHALYTIQVYAEIGEIVCGRKKGREGGEMIVVDLTGTGAQDAAIGQWAWNTLKNV
ncbi:hypothetical protein EON63_03745 [archaeon]|nr:MAG: hypothetical protein EON63_03745 [archaeon]